MGIVSFGKRQFRPPATARQRKHLEAAYLQITGRTIEERMTEIDLAD